MSKFFLTEDDRLFNVEHIISVFRNRRGKMRLILMGSSYNSINNISDDDYDKLKQCVLSEQTAVKKNE